MCVRVFHEIVENKMLMKEADMGIDRGNMGTDRGKSGMIWVCEQCLICMSTYIYTTGMLCERLSAVRISTTVPRLRVSESTSTCSQVQSLSFSLLFYNNLLSPLTTPSLIF